MPYLRQISFTGIPASASFKIATIWLSVIRLLIVKLLCFSLKEILRVSCIILRDSYTSSNRNHELSKQALNVLKRIKSYADKSEYVFLDPRTMKRWKNDGVPRERFWKKVFINASVRYLKPYSCRHTYASTMLSNGANPMWVASQLGHKDWGMIRKVYGRWVRQP
ncbi:MAG: hypothetical protein CMF17_09110 [Idiomarinaceae bacterium]|nr:hypothetical protein [Idiomarinaceae bacterium]